MTTSLTSDQKAGADEFFLFLHNEKRDFVLSGGAGVGKTFLMGHIANDVMQKYHDSCKIMGTTPAYDTVSFTATTNKAAEVLELSLGKPVQTVHSFLGLKVKDNYKTGKSDIEKVKNWQPKRPQIVFIDESSMIDSKLYDLIWETLPGSKVVFVGDHAQMSPVSEALSPIYANIDPQNFVFLNQPIRNADSPDLMNLCTQLRQTVETGEFFRIQEAPGSVEYLNKEEMPLALDRYFAKDLNPSARILCYTNERVGDYNEYIRQIRGLPEQITAGDILVVAQTYQNGKDMLSVEREVEILTVSSIAESCGYGSLFTDGIPIGYYEATLIVAGSQVPMEINLPENQERWKMGLKILAKQKRWQEFFELKNQCVDLRDKAACTAYKAQGSTYETVFIDLGNIGTSFDANQVARMLFVAASRPTSRIFLFGRLPNRYSGGDFSWSTVQTNPSVQTASVA